MEIEFIEWKPKKFPSDYTLKVSKICNNTEGKKILVLTGKVTPVEREEGIVLGGYLGIVLENCVKAAINIDELGELRVLNFKFLRDSDPHFDMAEKRLKLFFLEYQPDCVILLGPDIFDHFFPSYKGQWINYLGRVVKSKKLGKVVVSFELHQLANPEDKTAHNLLGFLQDHIETAIDCKNRYTIDMQNVENVFIKDIPTFKKFMRALEVCPTPSIDTEGENLNRAYNNQMLSLQVATEEKKCWFLPFLHNETPWSSEQITYIKKRLQNYFENGTSKYLIFQNAKYDLNVIRVNIGVRYWNHDIYDIQAGEFCLNESRKFLKRYGIKPYSLEFIAANYGAPAAYKNIAITKEERANMAKFSLQNIADYGWIDVAIPWQVAKFQQEKAILHGDENFVTCVTKTIGSQIHTFAEMEFNGLKVDSGYLIQQMQPGSDLDNQKIKVLGDLYARDSVKTSNDNLLLKSGKAVYSSLFSTGKEWIFDINKPYHKIELYFNVLKLLPVSKRKDGLGKCDKLFQEEYSAIPEVESLTKYNQVAKLYNTYIKGIWQQLQESEDSKKDHRIRASYNYTGVLTGRASAFKPGLQQIPSRGDLSKIIKRMFIASTGNIMIKKDFCLTGDSLIPTENGLVRIDSMGKHGKQKVIKDIQIKVAGAKTLNPAVKWVYVGVKPTVLVTTKSGNFVKCTSKHKLWVLRNGKVGWIKAGDCRIGDFLCLPKYDMSRTTTLNIDLSEPVKINTNNTTGFTNIFLDKRTGKYDVKIKNGKSYYYGGSFFSLDEAVTSRNNIWEHRGITNNRSFVNIKKPTEMTPALAWLLACIIADGNFSIHEKHNHVFFSSSNKDLIDRYAQELFSVFGLQANVYKKIKKGNVRVQNGIEFRANYDHWVARVRSNQLASWLQELGLYGQHGLRDGKTPSHFKCVPWSILQADKESQLSFLAGYLETDGGIKDTGNLCWYSTSEELLSGLRTILNSFGYITSTSQNKTAKTLVLGRLPSQDIWNYISKYMASKELVVCKRTERLGKIPGKLAKKWFNEETCTALEQDFHFTPIVSIADNGEQPVYDLTMDSSVEPKFVANSILLSNSAHEVRNWANIARDMKLASAFAEGMIIKRNLRKLISRNPEVVQDAAVIMEKCLWFDKEKAPSYNEKMEIARKRNDRDLRDYLEWTAKFEIVGDIHKKNHNFFFPDVPVEKTTKEQRSQIKSTIFGVTYGKMKKSLAYDIYKKELKTIDRDIRSCKDSDKIELLEKEKEPFYAKAQELIELLFTTFKQGGNWLRKVPEEARRTGIATSPLHRVRHLAGYLSDANWVHAAMDRRGPNSINQGFSSDIGFLACRELQTLVWTLFKKQGLDVTVFHCNQVHDALEVEANRVLSPVVLYLIEHAMCQTGDTLVPTSKGLRRLDSFSDTRYIGEPVAYKLKVASRFSPKYMAHWLYQGKKPTIIIETERGNTLQCTYTHPNLILSSDGTTDWRLAKECQVGDYLCINPKQLTRKSKLHLDYVPPKYTGRGSGHIRPITYPTKMTPMLAWLLAMIISEGDIGIYSKNYTIRIGNTDIKLIDKIVASVCELFGLNMNTSIRKNNIFNWGGRYTENTKLLHLATVSSRRLFEFLLYLGVKDRSCAKDGKSASYFKEVPWSILQADSNSQLAFLAGYLEGDGSTHTHRLVWTSYSTTILKQIQIVLNTHGVFPKLNKHSVALNETDSIVIWNKLKSFVVSKTLVISSCNRKSYGIPVEYWKSLLFSRKIEGKPYLFYNDQGYPVYVQGFNFSEVRQQSKFLYDTFDSGRYDEFLKNLKIISLSAYNKLVSLFKLRYYYTPISSIKEGGITDVYDISMKEGEEPAFIANGLVVHNTTRVHRVLKKVYDFDVLIGMEIDPEMGGSLATTYKTDYSVNSIINSIEKSSKWQTEVLDHPPLTSAERTRIKENVLFMDKIRQRELQKAGNTWVELSMLLRPEDCFNLHIK